MNSIKAGFSLKKISFEHKPKTRHGKVINILLKEFYININRFKKKDIICIDEISLMQIIFFGLFFK